MRTFLKIHGLGMILLVLGLCLSIDLGLAYMMGRPAGVPVYELFGIHFNPTQAGLCLLALAFFAWKAFGPLHGKMAMKEGRYAAASFSFLLFACAITFSIAMELSWYQQTIANQANWAAEVTDDRTNDSKRIDWLSKQIDERASLPSASELEAQINLIYTKQVGATGKRDTVGAMTKNCADSKSPAFSHCSPVPELQLQLTKAQTVDSYRSELRALRSERRNTETPVDLTSFGLVLSSVLGGDKKTYTYVIALIVMTFLQIGAATLPLITFGGKVPDPASAPATRRWLFSRKGKGAGDGTFSPVLAAVPAVPPVAPLLVDDHADDDAAGEQPAIPAVAAAPAVAPFVSIPAVARDGGQVVPFLVPSLARTSSLILPGDAAFAASSRHLDPNALIEQFAREHLRPSADGNIRSQVMWFVWQEMMGAQLGRNIFSQRLALALQSQGVPFSRGREGGGHKAWYGLEFSDAAALAMYRLNKSHVGGVGAATRVAA